MIGFQYFIDIFIIEILKHIVVGFARRKNLIRNCLRWALIGKTTVYRIIWCTRKRIRCGYCEVDGRRKERQKVLKSFVHLCCAFLNTTRSERVCNGSPTRIFEKHWNISFLRLIPAHHCDTVIRKKNIERHMFTLWSTFNVEWLNIYIYMYTYVIYM